MKYTCIKQHDITDCGAAKTKAQRQAAQTAAKKNVTKANVKQTGHMVAGYVGIMTGVAALTVATGGTTAIIAATGIMLGSVSIGQEL